MKSNNPRTSHPASSVDSAAPRWSGRHAPKESRRDSILKSVGAVLRDTGLSSLTMQDIALQLGITKGNLYYYFRDKQDILYQCHMRCMALSLAALHAAQTETGPRHACLRKLLIAHISGMLDDGFGTMLLADLDSMTPAQRTRYVARRDEFEAGVRKIVAAGVAGGEFECADIKLAGLSLLGAINWIPKWYHPDGESSAAAIAAGMTDFLMRALEPRTALSTGKRR